MANENLIDVKSKIITTSAVMVMTVYCMIFVVGWNWYQGTFPGLVPFLLFAFQVWYLSWGWRWLKGVKVIEWKAVNETVQNDLDSIRRFE